MNWISLLRRAFFCAFSPFPKILYLTKKSYDVTNVFITFEKERHKRIVLEKMALNRKHVRKQKSSGLPSNNFVFRKKVLLIREADEPSAVRWADLNTNLEFRRMTTIVSSLATILFLYLAVAVVGRWSELTTWGSSYLVRAIPCTFLAVRTLRNSATDRLAPLPWQYSFFGKKDFGLQCDIPSDCHYHGESRRSPFGGRSTTFTLL